MKSSLIFLVYKAFPDGFRPGLRRNKILAQIPLAFLIAVLVAGTAFMGPAQGADMAMGVAGIGCDVNTTGCRDYIPVNPDIAPSGPLPIPGGASGVSDQKTFNVNPPTSMSATGGVSGAIAQALVEPGPPLGGIGSLLPPRIRLSTSTTIDDDFGQAVGQAVAFYHHQITFRATPAHPAGATGFFRPKIDVSGSLAFRDGAFADWRFEWGVLDLIIEPDIYGIDNRMGGSGACTSFRAGPSCCIPGSPDLLGDAPIGRFEGGQWEFKWGGGFVDRVTAFAVAGGDSASTDLGGTIDWAGFEVRDSEGNLVTDFTVTSASGIDWTRSSKPAAQSSDLIVDFGTGSGIWVSIRPRR